MRTDEKGKFITLEDDIREIWEMHGLRVVKEEVEDKIEGMIWKITARRIEK